MPTGALPYSTRTIAHDRRPPGRWTGALRAGLLALALSAALPAAVAAQTAASAREYQIKAAFLFNFGQFVTWPPASLPARDAPFVLCVLGDDPFGATLDAIVDGGRIQDRAARIERHRAVEDALGCEVLFVSASEERRLDHILDVVAGRGILTVGETDDFIERGMIRFVLVQNRVRLHVNLAAAQEAGLTISSRLLSLADVVRR